MKKNGIYTNSCSLEDLSRSGKLNQKALYPYRVGLVACRRRRRKRTTRTRSRYLNPTRTGSRSSHIRGRRLIRPRSPQGCRALPVSGGALSRAGSSRPLPPGTTPPPRGLDPMYQRHSSRRGEVCSEGGLEQTHTCRKSSGVQGSPERRWSSY